jgi:hypothetical protein
MFRSVSRWRCKRANTAIVSAGVASATEFLTSPNQHAFVSGQDVRHEPDCERADVIVNFMEEVLISVAEVRRLVGR